MAVKAIQESRERALGRLKGLQAVILLAGSVRASRLRTAIGRAMLDLPIGRDRTLLQYWQSQAAGLGAAAGLRRVQVRVLVDREALAPSAPAAQEGVILSVERDPTDYRGTGGVLKDLSRGYAPGDYILVANAHQLLLQDLAELAERAAERQADVTVTSHCDGSVSSLMLLRCGVLNRLPEAGFIDMKEQGLPLIARHHRVEVLELPRASGMPIRSVADYIGALRRHHARANGGGEAESPWAEDWAARFSLVEAGAGVAEGARIHDSVVLRGGRVESGAVVVRSLVCPGGRVERGTLVAEELIDGPRAAGKGWA